MRLIGLAVVVAVSCLASPLTSEAQQSGKAPRIGMLFLGSQSIEGVRAEIVRDELRKLGSSRGRRSRSRLGLRTADYTEYEGWRTNS